VVSEKGEKSVYRKPWLYEIGWVGGSELGFYSWKSWVINTELGVSRKNKNSVSEENYYEGKKWENYIPLNLGFASSNYYKPNVTT
jgi:hypothetical protein